MILGLVLSLTGIGGGMYTLAYAGNHGGVQRKSSAFERLLYNNPHMAYELRRIRREARRRLGTGRTLRFRTAARLLRHNVRRQLTATLVATLLTVVSATTLVAAPAIGRAASRPVATSVRTRT